MNSQKALFATGLTILFALSASATVLYVDVNSTSPAPPYTNWASAARVIQDAVDAASSGDTVLVTNGTYRTGGWAMYYTYTNRVTLTKPLSLQSVNGPEVTLIQGCPGAHTWDASAVRCAWLSQGASLSGFTLTNGSTPEAANPVFSYGAGVWGDTGGGVLSNCVLVANLTLYGSGAAACYCTLLNCMIISNWAGDCGGGTWNCSLSNCTLLGNYADSDFPSDPGGGGGACYGSLTNCTLVGNRATDLGGGAFGATLYDCIVSNNWAYMGGGASGGTMNNCMIVSNTVGNSYAGGGVLGSTLSNCTLFGNSAGTGGGASQARLYNCLIISNSARGGGGSEDSELHNCTVVGNSGGRGGGCLGGTLNNSIVYFNTGAGTNANYSYVTTLTLNNCCTFPCPTDGTGNLTNAPLFIDAASGDFRLQANSPCVNAGSNAYAVGSTDLDGNPRIVGGTVDMGAYEFQGQGVGLFSAWLQQYNLATDGTADLIDSDQDGLNNCQEWLAGTDPTNALSVLKLSAPMGDVSGITVTWQSVSGKTYYLQQSTNLSAQPAFVSIQSNIAGQAGMTSYKDVTATNAGPYFYRVGLQ